MVTLSGRPWLHWVVVHGYIEWSAMVTLNVNGCTKLSVMVTLSDRPWLR